MIADFNKRQAPIMSRIISKEEAFERAVNQKEIYTITVGDANSVTYYAFTDHFGVPPSLIELGMTATLMPFPVPVGTEEQHKRWIDTLEDFIETFHSTDVLMAEEKPVLWISFQQFMAFYERLLHEFEQPDRQPIHLGDRFMKEFDMPFNAYLKDNENSQIFWYILENYVKLNV